MEEKEEGTRYSQTLLDNLTQTLILISKRRYPIHSSAHAWYKMVNEERTLPRGVVMTY